MKPEDAQAIIKVLQHRLPTRPTLIELLDGDVFELRNFFTGRDFGDEFDSLHINWSDDDFNYISVTDIRRVLDGDTNAVVFETQDSSSLASK